jgi:hypothetical protein
MPPTYAIATLRRRLKNLVSVGSPPPFSVFAKLQFSGQWIVMSGQEIKSAEFFALFPPSTIH